MSNDDKLQKTLAKINDSEAGWKKVLATAPGSFSRNLASENLRRLTELRATLLAEAQTAPSGR
ncbi:MAG: hypothetical protein ABI835_16095 [Chloroflexota bacterium]